MAAASPSQPFFWGAGGQAMSPEQVARQREIAAALMQQGSDYSPVGHWLQGAARASQGLVGGLKDRWANEAEQAGQSEYQELFNSVLGGGGGASPANPVAAALTGGAGMPQGVAPASMPTGDMAGTVRAGLISRGLPEHVADAFVLNMQDESGLNPGINEAAPTVPGSRGGYGLYQLTGPRRRAYEAYAQGQGIPLDSVDGQLDFLMSELQGPEAAAAKAIFAAPDTGSAAAAIVNQFLRPAEEHRARREASYLGGASMPPSNQVAQAGGGSPDIAALIGLAGNQWANPNQQAIVQSLLGQQMQQQDPRYQQQLAMGELDMQRAQLELQAMQNPGAPPPVFEGGQWWDTSQGIPQPISQPNVDPTAGIQNYEYLVSQGVPPEQAIERAFSGGVTVNTGDQGPQVGTIPPSMALVPDPSNPTGFRMETIPGSPEALAQAQAAEAAAIGGQNASATANIVREDLGRIRELVDNSTWFNPAVGFGADVAQAIAGSNASNVAALSKTVLANIGFDRLQQMRDASPTGGALGAISDRELGTLQSVMGNLEQSQSVDQFMYNLDRLGTIYDEILTKAAAYPNAGSFGVQAPAGGESQQQSYPNAPEIGALVEGYRFKGGDPAVMENWERAQ